MKVLKKYKKDILAIFIAVILYIIISNARGVSQNPFDNEITLEITATIPILAGLLISKRAGFSAGFIAPMVSFLLTNELFQATMAVPYAILGYIAGEFSNKIPSPIIALLILPANMLAYLFIGKADAWAAFLYESFIGFIAIIVITNIYRISFQDVDKY